MYNFSSTLDTQVQKTLSETINLKRQYRQYAHFYYECHHQLEEASTHKSAKTDTGNTFAAGCVWHIA